jgi:hypothetical protein
MKVLKRKSGEKEKNKSKVMRRKGGEQQRRRNEVKKGETEWTTEGKG